MLLRDLGEERAGSCNDCILWQVLQPHIIVRFLASLESIQFNSEEVLE